MKPLATFLLASLLGFAASGQADMSVPVVASSNAWTFDGITRLYSVEPPPSETGNKDVWYEAVLNEYTNQAGKVHATLSYAGKQDSYSVLAIETNGDGSIIHGWIGPNITPPTGQRISFCCGTFEFFAATNPPESQRYFQCGRPAYGMTPINESTDLVNWLLFKFAPLTNPPALTCRVKTVKLPWPVN